MPEATRLDVTFLPDAYTFVPVPEHTELWHTIERWKKGVYLWCIEYASSYLVNYVGKTTNRHGFESRLWTELKDWRKGRHCLPVDIEAFKRGSRISLAHPPTDHLKRELAALEPLMRILLAPMEHDTDCIQAESTIVNALRRNPFTYQFLANGDKDKKYNPKPSPGIRFVECPSIIGITVPPVPKMEDFDAIHPPPTTIEFSRIQK